MNRLETFPDRGSLFAETARIITAALQHAAEASDNIAFAASGGRTPEAVYEQLSQDEMIPWENVSITLTDERRAPADAEIDNARMIKRSLLKGPAAQASFYPLDNEHALDDFPQRFAAVLLGMGGDGHFASIFPHSEGTKAALAGGESRIMPVTPDPLPKEAPYPRWTLSLPALANTDSLLLLITGDEKRQVLEGAGEGDPAELPIRALLQDKSLPLHILWAP